MTNMARRVGLREGARRAEMQADRMVTLTDGCRDEVAVAMVQDAAEHLWMARNWLRHAADRL
jgi:hypothetical protein